MKTLILSMAVPVAATFAAAPASAADWYFRVGGGHHPGHVYRHNHARHHDDLAHRAFHRELAHREAHRYPMTWRQHGRLHDHLEHEAFHDHLEHRHAHRSGAYYPRSHHHWQTPSYGFRIQGRGFSFGYGY